jgi:hypothetical protein
VLMLRDEVCEGLLSICDACLEGEEGRSLCGQGEPGCGERSGVGWFWEVEHVDRGKGMFVCFGLILTAKLVQLL